MSVNKLCIVDIKKNIRNTNINRKRYDVGKFLGRYRDEEIIIGWEDKNEEIPL
jgi:hypothetical protein